MVRDRGREAQETQIRGIQNPRLGLSRDPVCPSSSSLVVQARLFDENEQKLERFDSIPYIVKCLPPKHEFRLPEPMSKARHGERPCMGGRDQLIPRTDGKTGLAHMANFWPMRDPVSKRRWKDPEYQHPWSSADLYTPHRAIYL